MVREFNKNCCSTLQTLGSVENDAETISTKPQIENPSSGYLGIIQYLIVFRPWIKPSTAMTDHCPFPLASLWESGPHVCLGLHTNHAHYLLSDHYMHPFHKSQNLIMICNRPAGADRQAGVPRRMRCGDRGHGRVAAALGNCNVSTACICRRGGEAQWQQKGERGW